jgi:hypothetical protein
MGSFDSAVVEGGCCDDLVITGAAHMFSYQSTKALSRSLKPTWQEKGWG